MLTRDEFKNKYEVDGKIQTTIIRALFQDIEDSLATNNNIEWLADRDSWLKDFGDCLLHYTNEIQRNITNRKNNKVKFGFDDRQKWIVWVEKTNDFKEVLNDLRLNSIEVQKIVNSKLKSLRKKSQLKATVAAEKNKNKPIRYAIHVVFHNGSGYENILLYSDVLKITTQDLASQYIDEYQTRSQKHLVMVNYRAFQVSSDFSLKNSKMVNIASFN